MHLPAPAGFSFRRTVLSHGWCMLPPFELGARGASLATTFEVPGGRALRVTLREADGGIAVETPGRAPARSLEAAARRMLGLDVAMDGFHDAVRAVPRLRWIAETGSGRLLRAPSGFEDLIKLVLTTNCAWSLTTRMTSALVARYGAAAEDGTKAFPTPERLAGAGERELRETARLGYRAPFVAALARDAATGALDPDFWAADGRSAQEIRRDLLRLPGVGPYVAENLLKLAGRPDGLALDSWMRAKYARVHHGGRRVTDRTIGRAYARLGPWAGLAAWFDLTRDWFDGEEPSAAWEALS